MGVWLAMEKLLAEVKNFKQKSSLNPTETHITTAAGERVRV